MKVCPACGYPSIGVCAACTKMIRASRLESFVSGLAASSPVREMFREQIGTGRPLAPPSLVDRGDHFGVRAAVLDVPRVVGPT